MARATGRLRISGYRAMMLSAKRRVRSASTKDLLRVSDMPVLSLGGTACVGKRAPALRWNDVAPSRD